MESILNRIYWVLMYIGFIQGMQFHYEHGEQFKADFWSNMTSVGVWFSGVAVWFSGPDVEKTKEAMFGAAMSLTLIVVFLMAITALYTAYFGKEGSRSERRQRQREHDAALKLQRDAAKKGAVEEPQ